jgi:hypothetical protein
MFIEVILKDDEMNKRSFLLYHKHNHRIYMPSHKRQQTPKILLCKKLNIYDYSINRQLFNASSDNYLAFHQYTLENTCADTNMATIFLGT